MNNSDMPVTCTHGIENDYMFILLSCDFSGEKIPKTCSTSVLFYYTGISCINVGIKLKGGGCTYIKVSAAIFNAYAYVMCIFAKKKGGKGVVGDAYVMNPNPAV